MPRTICVLNPEEAELVSSGVAVSHKGHQHVTRKEARLMVLGTMKAPELDPDYDRETGEVSAEFHGVAFRLNDRQIVRYLAREWQVLNGVKQFLALGATKQRPRRTKMHIRKPVYSSPRQCWDNNHGDRPHG